MEPLFTDLSEAEADLYGLVLTATDIPFRFRNTDEGWTILVDPRDQSRALSEIVAFHSENIDTAEPAPAPQKTGSAWIAAASLVAAYWLFGPFGENALLVSRLGASAEAILHGQIWRSVTALFLHADSLHLLGNIVALILFGSGVVQVTGWGVAWLLILVAGAMGNLANAVFYQSQHLSAGASTAVFGALGLLTGFRLKPSKADRARGPLSRPWVVVGAGLALLAFLGNSPRSDLMAHLFGWLCGIVAGLVYASLFARPLPLRHQVLALAVTITGLATAWTWASAG